MKESIEKKTTILIGLSIAALVSANLLGSKVSHFLGITVSVGIFAYPLTFLITDIIEEVHGKRKVMQLVLAGFIALVFVLALTALSRWLPPADRYPHNDAFVTVFGGSLRMIFASLVAFGISQTHDVWAFNFWKQKTKGRYLWLRNNLSTAVSQFIDTVIFMFIAFYMAAPKFTASFVITLIIPYWILKVLVAALDTPLCYLGVKWLRGK